MSKPLYDMLFEYREKDNYPWHMPGHKRKLEQVIDNPYSIDYTEVNGTDDLHDPSEGILKAQTRAALIYGSKKSYYVVNGSTAGILSSLWAVTNRSDQIIMARNCHKSVYNGVRILGLTPSYIYPEYIEKYNMYGGILINQVETAIKNAPEAKAIVIVSPTYEGVVSDICAIARLAHDNNMYLIVDEAHGAHFEFNECFPHTAIRLGADIVIESLHKTLSSPTQTSIVHSNMEGNGQQKLEDGLKIFQSSSPSYMLMAGMDYAVFKAENDRIENYPVYVECLKNFRANINKLKNIKLIHKDDLGEAAFDYDISKIVLSVKDEYRKIGFTGQDLSDLLEEKYRQVLEMSTLTYAIAMTSVMDEAKNFNSLLEALGDIDVWLETRKCAGYNCKDNVIYENIIPVIRFNPCDITYDMERLILRENAIGEISTRYIYLYPPGVPIVVPGEIITEEVVNIIDVYVKNHLSIKGIEISASRIYLGIKNNGL